MVTLTTLDKVAMVLAGGLVVLGLPILGFVLAVTSSDCPPFYPIIRGYMVLLGFLVFMALGMVKLFVAPPDA